ncbi:MAG TPA: beta-L-arabinofuranosidase domain-containing protein, partial [Thermoguttaceae bacterium]|nr:beta-L-arabinofuranosidase domain-containing protein [Thermoguttaceae bacterium]
MYHTRRIVLLVVMANVAPAAHAEDRSPRDGGIIKNQESPHARLRNVDLHGVRWTDGFWAEQFAKCRDVTVPRLWDLAADPEAGHALANMKIAAGLQTGPRKGTDWQDAWLYKWIETACYISTISPDVKLDRQLDEIIAIIAKAQQHDGYLATQTIVRGTERYVNPGQHELYTMGHLLSAACVHHRVTGKRNFLEVAVRVADHVRQRFKDRDPALVDFPRNPSIIMGAVELYRTTGDRRHLDLANFFIDWRGSQYKPFRNAWAPASGGSDLNQNYKPLRLENEVVGHAVFFTYLYAGAADAYMETGDRQL